MFTMHIVSGKFHTNTVKKLGEITINKTSLRAKLIEKGLKKSKKHLNYASGGLF